MSAIRSELVCTVEVPAEARKAFFLIISVRALLRTVDMLADPSSRKDKPIILYSKQIHLSNSVKLRHLCFDVLIIFGLSTAKVGGRLNIAVHTFDIRDLRKAITTD